MNILMMTNTYLPIIGGLEHSVKKFSEEYRKRGHKVLIVTPEFDNMPTGEEGVLRIPAVKHVKQTEYSIALPIPGLLRNVLNEYKPELVHSHFPYLIGDTALRTAARYEIPIVFTFHSLYEKYTHYVAGDSLAFKRFALALSVGYANLCDHIIAPSKSIKEILEQRGVTRPITVIPTGICLEKYTTGNGSAFRKAYAIPAQAFVITYTGRIEEEKNIAFLAGIVGRYLKKDRNAYFLLVGKGSRKQDFITIFQNYGLMNRVRVTGVLLGQKLIDAYHAADLFTFSSLSETQGIVLTEAMACGLPVVALDAPGSRDIIRDKYNGRLVSVSDGEGFLAAVSWVRNLDEKGRQLLKQQARLTAQDYDIDDCVNRALNLYRNVKRNSYTYCQARNSAWEKILRQVKAEWELVSNLARATGSAMDPHRPDGEDGDRGFQGKL